MKDAAVGVIFNEDQTEVLVLQRRDVPAWVLPAGGIETGEQPEEAVVREVKEETGLHVKVKRKVGEYTPTNKLTRLSHVFECQIVGGQLSIGNETRYLLFSRTRSLPEPFFELHQEWLQDALKNLPKPVVRPLANVTYWAVLKYFFRHPIMTLRFALSLMGVPINKK